MRDLSFCQRPFDDAAQAIPSHDPRFLHIADLAQKSQFGEAADAIEALHQENLYDARLWGYYLYRAFEEDGCGRLSDVFDAIQAITTREWREVLPKSKAPAYLNRAIGWLLQTLLASLEYHQTNKDPTTWKKWIDGVDQERLGHVIDRAEALLKTLPEPAFHQTIEQLSKMLRWLRQLHGELSPKPAAAEKTKESQTMSAPKEAPSAPEPSLSAPGQSLQLRGSPKLWELLSKLKAFETLVERRAFQRAALVGDDIMLAIESFDPRDYFPELFARFGALFHAHVKEISPHWQAKESMEWKALAQFYHVDLDGFVKKE